MSKGGRYLNTNKAAGNQKAKKASGWKKTLLIVLIAVLVLLIGVVIAAVMFYQSKLNLITRPERTENELSQEELDAILSVVPTDDTVVYEETTEATTEATEAPYVYTPGKLGKIVNIMLVGQSYREGEETKLADSMILCTINKETRTLTMTSFLRDMYLKLPNFQGHTCGNQRINVAYNLGWHWAGELGGMEMLNQCIYENFGVEVDYSVEVNFDAFKEVIDMLGGIEMELTAEEADYLNEKVHEVRYSEGMNRLNKTAALHYARMRKSSGSDSDIVRAERQRKVISLLLEKIKGLSLSELNDIIDAVLPQIITDMSNEDITTCMLELLPLLSDLTIESNQCPAEGTYSGQMVEIYDVLSGVLVPNIQKNREILMAVAEADQLEATAATE